MKSYRSGLKEPKESKADKRKRAANNRMAQEQAKKYVIPGLIAAFACLFFVLVGKYGLKGSKPDNSNPTDGLGRLLMDLRQGGSPLGKNSKDFEDTIAKQVMEALAQEEQKMAAAKVFEPAQPMDPKEAKAAAAKNERNSVGGDVDDEAEEIVIGGDTEPKVN